MVALAQRTDRPSITLEEYARKHGNVPEEIFRRAGWRDGQTRKDRPAISFPTATGPRWRFTDGQKPKFDHAVGYVACWYGLNRALSIAAQDCPPILTNGAPSVIAGQYHGLPAFALSSGESSALTPDLLGELAQKYPAPAPIWIAPDHDENQTGIKSARKRAGQLIEAGYMVRILDLGLTEDKADLADFCGQHGTDSLAALGRCSDLPLVDPNAPAPRPRREYDRVSSADQDRAKDDIRSRLSCYDFMVDKSGAPLRKGHGYGQWLAPHRTEKTASFTAYEDPLKGWADFGGSGEGGDIFSLIMLVEGCDFPQALRIGAERANVQLPERPRIAAPAEFSARATAAQDPTAGPVKVLPYAVEIIMNEYEGKRAEAMLTLLRAILEYPEPDGSFDLPTLATASGTNYRQLHRGQSYGVSKLCREAAPRLDNVRSLHSSSLPEDKDQENTMSSSDIYSPLPGKRAVRFQLRSNWIDLLPDVLKLGAVEKVAKKKLSPKAERATIERYRAIWAQDGQPYELTAVDEVNARLLSEIPQAIQQAVDEELASIRRRLSDRRGDSLPDLWKTDYRAALAERDLRTRIGMAYPRYKTSAATGLSRAAQRSAERRIYIKREEQFNPEPLIVEKIADLPDPVRTPGGFPVRATFNDGETLDYRSARNRATVAARVGAGERCRIDRQLASIIREMSPEDRAAQEAKRTRPAKPAEQPPVEQARAQAERQAEQAYKAAVDTVKWQLDYLGYKSMNGATYDRDGVLMAEQPISALRGSDLIALARGKDLITFEAEPPAIENLKKPEIFPHVEPPEVTHEGQVWAPVTEIVESEPVEPTADEEWNFVPQWDQPVQAYQPANEALIAALIQMEVSRRTADLYANGYERTA